MQRVLNPPMTTYRTGKRPDFGCYARNEEAGFASGFLLAYLSFAEHHAQGAQALPGGVPFGKLFGHGHDMIMPCLEAAMVLIDSAVIVMLDVREVVLQSFLKEFLD